MGFNEARAQSNNEAIIIENYVTGFDHRMLVVNGELVAVSKRVPGHVVGDGEKTIEVNLFSNDSLNLYDKDVVLKFKKF